MTKIDCSVTVDFLREWRRYCGGRRCGNCDLCKYSDGDTCELCWHEPLVDGATGKAVE